MSPNPKQRQAPKRSPGRYQAIVLGLLASCLGACQSTDSAPTALSGARWSGEAATWWKEIGDRKLQALVREALEESPSVEILAARVELARASSQTLIATTQPSISAQGAVRFGERQEFETGGEPADVMRFAGRSEFSWELDFWGRVRQVRQGARLRTEAAVADGEAGKRILIADIARLEFARRRFAAEAKLVAEALSSNNASVERLAEKEDAGIIDRSTIDRQTAESDALGRELEELKRQRRIAELALDRLLGREPGAKSWPTAPSLPAKNPAPKIIKTELLANRPDIAASAARVAATWHLSKAATLDLLPKLQLGALAGARTVRITPSIDEWILQVAPSLEVPVWDPVRLAKVKKSKAEAYLAAVAYRDDVLNAIEEARVALVNLNAYAKIERSARASATTLEKIYSRTQEKFLAGVASQLEVLEDQRSSLDAGRAALRAQEAGLAAWIDLSNAIGR